MGAVGDPVSAPGLPARGFPGTTPPWAAGGRQEGRGREVLTAMPWPKPEPG